MYCSRDSRRVSSVSSIEIVGHTDSKGTEAYNFRLGQRRADTVANYLASNGVPSSIISTRSRGELDPVDPLERGTGGDHERCDHAGDAQLAATLGQLLADEEDGEERDRRDDRDEPGVLQEPTGGLRSVLGGFFNGEQHQPLISESSSSAIERRLR